MSAKNGGRNWVISSFKKGLHSCSKLAELIFFPSYCWLCSSLLEWPGESLICRSCWGSLKYSLPSYCLCCGRLFEFSEEPHLCVQCLKESPPFSRHRSCGQYKGKLKDVILLFKYRKFKILGKGLALFAAQALGEEESLWGDVEIIMPVPLHPQRKRERGFNQSQVIAKELASYQKIDFIPGLEKKKNVLPQTVLSMAEREKNVKGVFAAKNLSKIKGRVVLLVDDVFTTGATISECSTVLRKAGVKEVRALTLAQARLYS